MSTTGRANETAPDASAVAGQLREAEFVRLVGTATGDGLAACGVLARSLAALDQPFQVSLAPFAADAARATDADLTVAVGRSDPAADLDLPGTVEPASATAFAVARELGRESDESRNGTDSDVVLALAGVTADGRVAGNDVANAGREAGYERRPGLALPTTDLADGLAHSAFVHASFSGDADAAMDFLADHGIAAVDATDRSETDLSDDERQRLASAVALDAVGSDDVPSRGGDAVERFLRPFAGGPLATIDGYGDVLDAVARERPGTGVALALGHDVSDDALDAWRTHGARAHAAVRTADTRRHDGLFVVRPADQDAPVGTVARLVHAYRSPEPVTLVATDGAAAVVADEADVGASVRTAASAVGGTGEATESAAGVDDSNGTTGRARFDADADAFVAAFREAGE